MRANARGVEWGIWCAAIALALVAARGWSRAVAVDATAAAEIPVAPGVPGLIDGDSLDEAAIYAYEHDPFRLERRPSGVAYVPGAESAPAAPPSPRPSKPALVLTGIMGGPPWQGVVDGIPGSSGSTVVMQGQVLGEAAGALRVTKVTSELVTIEGLDTTWTLTVRRGW